MWRLTERMVRSGLVMAWRLATSPTRTSPDLEKPTTDGVVRLPSALGMTVGSPASRTLTTELVVPRSIPTALGMVPPDRVARDVRHDDTSKVECLVVKAPRVTRPRRHPGSRGCPPPPHAGGRGRRPTGEPRVVSL